MYNSCGQVRSQKREHHDQKHKSAGQTEAARRIQGAERQEVTTVVHISLATKLQAQNTWPRRSSSTYHGPRIGFEWQVLRGS